MLQCVIPASRTVEEATVASIGCLDSGGLERISSEEWDETMTNSLLHQATQHLRCGEDNESDSCFRISTFTMAPQ